MDDQSHNLTLCGDFNTDLFSCHSEHFLDSINALSIPHSSKKITANSAMLIDDIFMNKPVNFIYLINFF